MHSFWQVSSPESGSADFMPRPTDGVLRARRDPKGPTQCLHGRHARLFASGLAGRTPPPREVATGEDADRRSHGRGQAAVEPVWRPPLIQYRPVLYCSID
jgi:hypothetical protein